MCGAGCTGRARPRRHRQSAAKTCVLSASLATLVITSGSVPTGVVTGSESCGCSSHPFSRGWTRPTILARIPTPTQLYTRARAHAHAHIQRTHARIHSQHLYTTTITTTPTHARPSTTHTHTRTHSQHAHTQRSLKRSLSVYEEVDFSANPHYDPEFKFFDEGLVCANLRSWFARVCLFLLAFVRVCACCACICVDLCACMCEGMVCAYLLSWFAHVCVCVHCLEDLCCRRGLWLTIRARLITLRILSPLPPSFALEKNPELLDAKARDPAVDEFFRMLALCHTVQCDGVCSPLSLLHSGFTHKTLSRATSKRREMLQQT